MSEYCETCKFSKPKKHTPCLECCRFPPQFVKYILDSDCIFPTVNVDDWCGEFKPKPPEPKT